MLTLKQLSVGKQFDKHRQDRQSMDNRHNSLLRVVDKDDF